MRSARFSAVCQACLLLIFSSFAAAQGGPRPTPPPQLPSYPNFAAAMQAAQGFLAAKNPDKAKLSFESALLLASDDDQRADVHFGVADVYLATKTKVRQSDGSYADEPDHFGAVRELEKAAALKSVSPEKKRRAYDRIIETAALAKNHWRIALTYDAIFKAFPQMPAAERVVLMFKKAEAYPHNTAENARYSFQAYQAITTFSGVGDTDKARAYLKMGDLENRFGTKQGAFQHYSSASLTPAASAEQKATATLLAGKMLWELGQAEQGQAMIAKVIEMKDAPAANKAEAHMLLASSYGHQKKPDMQLAEYAKVASIKGVSDEDKAKAYYSMGDLHMKAERYAAARAEFKKVLPLKQAPNSYIAAAHYFIGKAFEKENNAKEARSTWNKMLTVAESPQHRADALAALAGSFRDEKKYAEAADAHTRRAAIDKLSAAEKHAALTDLGDVHLEAKDAAKAAAAYAQASAVTGEIKEEQRYRAYSGAVEAGKLQKDPAKLAAAYGGLAEFTQRATKLPGDTRGTKLKELWEVADATGRDDATAATALAIYDGILKGNAGIVVSTTNRANLAAADILIRQKKFPEAKERLQKVSVGNFPNDEALKKQVAEATEKIQKMP